MGVGGDVGRQPTLPCASARQTQGKYQEKARTDRRQLHQVDVPTDSNCCSSQACKEGGDGTGAVVRAQSQDVRLHRSNAQSELSAFTAEDTEGVSLTD